MPRKTFVAGDVLTAADMNLLAQDGYVTNASLDTTAGEPGGAWATFTPTVTGISNLTLTGRRTQIGKTVTFWIKGVYTASSSVTGNLVVNLPVTAQADVCPAQFYATARDVSQTNPGQWEVWLSVQNATTTQLTITAGGIPGTYGPRNSADFTSGIPISWATGDIITITGTYEAA